MTGDLAGAVDTIGVSVETAGVPGKSSQIGHGSVGIQKCMRISGGSVGVSNDLPVVVYPRCKTACPAGQRAQIGHGSVGIKECLVVVTIGGRRIILCITHDLAGIIDSRGETGAAAGKSPQVGDGV